MIRQSILRETYDAMTITSDVMERQIWENEFESIDGVTRIQEKDYARLQGLLANAEDIDTYLTSPAYYLFTGREGLWVYANRGHSLFVCWHPNVSGQILIFSPLESLPNDILSELLNVIPTAPKGISIVRAKPDFDFKMDALLTQNRYIDFDKKEEAVLDWRYPVHILSTKESAALKGGKYMRVRNHLRQLNGLTVTISSFDSSVHGVAIERLYSQWVLEHSDSKTEFENTRAAYAKLFSLAKDQSLNLRGIVIFIEGSLSAVALWEEPSKNSDTANLFASLCDISVHRLSELLIVKSCEMLYQQGIPHLNLGGSETSGLDIFKRKFRPLKSIDLCSIDVNVESLSESGRSIFTAA